MKNKTLISLISLFTLSSCGSTDYSMYNFKGKIGACEISFTNITYKLGAGDNILKIGKPDGRIIISTDGWWNDLKIENTAIIQNGKIKTYTLKNKVEKTVVEEAQKQYDYYLERIKEIKINEGINFIR